MSDAAAATAALATGALVGSLPSGWLLVRAVSGVDPRREGSGSTGATNAFRLAGPAAGTATLAVDAAKGCAAVLAAGAICRLEWVPAAALVLAISSHAWNPWLRLRGGRGAATAAGGFALLAPWATLAAIAVFAAIVALTRIVSIGSVAGAVALPVAAALQGEPRATILATCAAAGVIVARHRRNLRRLLAGTEPRLGDRTARRERDGEDG